ncbi:NAD(P)H-binding protein [Actinocorallia populi]|uniref:NAD(P)H-binding protein n=1 Tax=Actinocorallia populi TaxID=2079200 RepID=UPI000D086D99|nr:NAD(P)H-binding protein [Actinocorallia populi]
MRIVVVGGHGQIALRLLRLLPDGTAVGVVRNRDQVPDLEATGQEGAIFDLEEDPMAELAILLQGADAVVFAAGAGPGSGAARKATVDQNGAILCAEAAQEAGVRRFVQISATGVDQPPPPGTEESWAAYVTAKRVAEEDLRARDLDWTILRPGRLIDGQGTGLVRLTDPPAERGDIPREDVAAVIAELIRTGAGVHRTLELHGGPVPIAEAVAAL